MPNSATTAWYQLSVTDVFAKLTTSEKGLSEGDVKHRLVQYGPNQLTAKKKTSAFSLYLSQFKNTLTIILLIAAVMILGIYFFGERETSDLIEAGLIFAIVFMITLLGFAQEYKAENAIASLKKLMAFRVTVRRDGKEVSLGVENLVPGDIVILEEGLKIPADIRLIESISLQVIEAALTGESVPVSKSIAIVEGNKEISDQTNMVFSGTNVASGRGIGIVVATGDTTALGHIAKNVSEVEDTKTHFELQLEKIGKSIATIIIAICVIVFFYLVFFASHETHLLPRILHAFIAAVALAVAAIPEGLPAVVVISLALGTQRMLKKNALVRKLNSIETLGATDVICSDKTGTLTKGEMTVSKVFVDGKTYDVTGTGYDTSGLFLLDKNQVSPTPLTATLTAGLLCNNAKLDGSSILGDPTEAALLVTARKAKLESTATRVHEVPFTSERKRMTVVVSEGDTYMVYMKGAPEMVLASCSVSAKERKELTEKIDEFSSAALRTLGFAAKKLTKSQFEKIKDSAEKIEKDLTFLGLQALSDPPRSEVPLLIRQCQDSGIRTIMITGDHGNTARAIAHEIGIPGDVLTGEELEKLSDTELKEQVEHISIYARVNPSTKMRIVTALQNNKHLVAMTGDGVNDAPALKKADIGIAMGITGTDVAKEASDMVLLDDKFSTIVSAIEEGRGIYHNIRKFVIYLLSSNIAEVFVVFLSIILFKNVPLTATMLLWINVVTDGIPAVALGLDPTEKGIMRYNPSVFQEKIITRKVWMQMIGCGVLVSVIVLGLYAQALSENAVLAQSVAFTMLVVVELVMLFLVRSSYNVGLWSNRSLIGSVVLMIALQIGIITIPFFMKLFELTPLSLTHLTLILLGCVWVFLAGKLYLLGLESSFWSSKPNWFTKH